MRNTFTAIVQARLGSSRFPEKVIKDLNGRTMIEFLIERLRRCKDINEIILATTKNNEDQILQDIGEKNNIKVFRGEVEDVLSRYFNASLETASENIIRITGDCPLIDPEIISFTIKEYLDNNYDYISNAYPPTFPDGLDIEVFSKKLLEETHFKCKNSLFREHVTPWMRENSLIKKGTFESKEDFSSMRWTVDEPEDLDVIRFVVNQFNGKSNFTWLDVLKLEKNFPEVLK